MERRAVNFVYTSEEGRGSAADGSRLVNLFPEVRHQGTYAPVVLLHTHGLEHFEIPAAKRVFKTFFFDNELFFLVDREIGEERIVRSGGEETLLHTGYKQSASVNVGALENAFLATGHDRVMIFTPGQDNTRGFVLEKRDDGYRLFEMFREEHSNTAYPESIQTDNYKNPGEHISWLHNTYERTLNYNLPAVITDANHGQVRADMEQFYDRLIDPTNSENLYKKLVALNNAQPLNGVDNEIDRTVYEYPVPIAYQENTDGVLEIVEQDPPLARDLTEAPAAVVYRNEIAGAFDTRIGGVTTTEPGDGLVLDLVPGGPEKVKLGGTSHLTVNLSLRVDASELRALLISGSMFDVGSIVALWRFETDRPAPLSEDARTSGRGHSAQFLMKTRYLLRAWIIVNEFRVVFSEVVPVQKSPRIPPGNRSNWDNKNARDELLEKEAIKINDLFTGTIARDNGQDLSISVPIKISDSGQEGIRAFIPSPAGFLGEFLHPRDIISVVGDGGDEGLFVYREAVGGGATERRSPLVLVSHQTATDDQITEVNSALLQSLEGTLRRMKLTGNEIFDAVMPRLGEVINTGIGNVQTVAWQDGYFLMGRSGSSRIYSSRLGDTVVPALSFTEADSRPGQIRKLISSRRQLFAFTDTSMEMYYNSGDNDFPFDRYEGGTSDYGCASPNTVVQENNTVYFLSEDGRVYMTTSVTPIEISTAAIADEIRKGDISRASAVVYARSRHTFYCLTVPGLDRSLCYDFESRAWHYRQSYDENGQLGPWRVSQITRSGSNHICIDRYSDRRLGLLSDKPTEFGEAVHREAVSTVIHIQRNRMFMPSFEVYMDLQGVEGRIEFSYTDDRGLTWSTPRGYNIPESQAEHRIIFHGLGAFRERQVRLSFDESMPVVIVGAFVQASRGLT